MRGACPLAIDNFVIIIRVLNVCWFHAGCNRFLALNRAARVSKRPLQKPQTDLVPNYTLGDSLFPIE